MSLRGAETLRTKCFRCGGVPSHHLECAACLASLLHGEQNVALAEVAWRGNVSWHMIS